MSYENALWTWDKLDQHIVDKAIGEWQKRLQACMVAGGRQLIRCEHFSWIMFCQAIFLKGNLFRLFAG